jgi:hypothetical protein
VAFDVLVEARGKDLALDDPCMSVTSSAVRRPGARPS